MLHSLTVIACGEVPSAYDKGVTKYARPGCHERAGSFVRAARLCRRPRRAGIHDVVVVGAGLAGLAAGALAEGGRPRLGPDPRPGWAVSGLRHGAGKRARDRSGGVLLGSGGAAGPARPGARRRRRTRARTGGPPEEGRGARRIAGAVVEVAQHVPRPQMVLLDPPRLRRRGRHGSMASVSRPRSARAPAATMRPSITSSADGEASRSWSTARPRPSSDAARDSCRPGQGADRPLRSGDGRPGARPSPSSTGRAGSTRGR